MLKTEEQVKICRQCGTMSGSVVAVCANCWEVLPALEPTEFSGNALPKPLPPEEQTVKCFQPAIYKFLPALVRLSVVVLIVLGFAISAVLISFCIFTRWAE